MTCDGMTSTVTVHGIAPDQQSKEKIALCCGNVVNMATVNDQMIVGQSEPEVQHYTVVRGDTLSRISKQY